MPQRLIVVKHAVLADRLTVLRDRTTSHADFRQALFEAAAIMAVEVARELPVREVEVETPLETTRGPRLAEEVAVVPVLRAGLGMVEGFLRLLPDARVGHLGIRRNEDDHEPIAYFERLPSGVPDMRVFVLDPMLATGGSAVNALQQLSSAGARQLEPFIDESHLDQPDFEGAKYVYTPPPRPASNHEHLWTALSSGVLSVVSTDHCPFRWLDQKTIGRDDFSKIPNGGPGIENRLHMLHNFGVRTGRLSMNQFVDLCCTQPAKLFGLFPRKGTIAVGTDADLVIWDSEKPLTLSASTHHTNVDYNLYEGTEVLGAPETVLVRGQVIVDHDELVGAPGSGQFLQRERFGQPLRRSRRAAAA